MTYPYWPSSAWLAGQVPFGLNVFPSRRMKLPLPFFSGPSLEKEKNAQLTEFLTANLRVEIMMLPSARQCVVWGVATPWA
jgi:hypothetical protein